MTLTPAICPNCGGKLIIDREKEFVICKFCNSEIKAEEGIRAYEYEVSVINQETASIDSISVESATVEKLEDEDQLQTLLRVARSLLAQHDFSGSEMVFQRILEIDPQNADAYLGLLMAQLRVDDERTLETCRRDFLNNKEYKETLLRLPHDRREWLQKLASENAAAEKYDKAKDLLDKKYFIEAAEAFNELGNYEDSHEQYMNAQYEAALRDYSQGEYLSSILSFSPLGDYRNSDSMLLKAVAKEVLLVIMMLLFTGLPYVLWKKESYEVMIILRLSGCFLLGLMKKSEGLALLYALFNFLYVIGVGTVVFPKRPGFVDLFIFVVYMAIVAVIAFFHWKISTSNAMQNN